MFGSSRPSVDRSPALDLHALRTSAAAEVVASASRSDLSKVVSTAVAEQPSAFGDLLVRYQRLRDQDRKIDIFRALRAAAQSHPRVFEFTNGDEILREGAIHALNVLAVPLGARQGFGLLTDFHLVSQACLRRVGAIRFLPLPAPFPVRRESLVGQGVLPWNGSVIEEISHIFEPAAHTHMGRSICFEIGPQVPRVVAKRGAADPKSLGALHFEASVMTYLLRFREYFGLRSDLPRPFRGCGNREFAWGFEGVPHLMYAANEPYVHYIDEQRTLIAATEALHLTLHDLMRLARFGVFHTELAPIFHSKEQGRRHLWNVGGLLVGAGGLKEWDRAFRFANMRPSGIADFEHIQRFPRMNAVAEIVNDTEPARALGLQYHLGNNLFCALHVLGLWCRRHAEWPVELPGAVKDLFGRAFESFTGSPWKSIDEDLDAVTIASEMRRFMGAVQGGPDHWSHDGESSDLGAFSGAYPAQSIIKGITAFTLRAIPEFLRRRDELRAELGNPRPREPEPIEALLPAPPLPDFSGLMKALQDLRVMKQLVEAGLPSDAVSSVVQELRLGEAAHARQFEDAEPILVVSVVGLHRAVRRVVGAEQARALMKISGLPTVGERANLWVR